MSSAVAQPQEARPEVPGREALMRVTHWGRRDEPGIGPLYAPMLAWNAASHGLALGRGARRRTARRQ